jgi:tRNA(Arg) A34 adenosine deaminase TadA
MSENTHLYFIEKTISLASEKVGKLEGGPFAAIVVKDGKIISEGNNLVTSANDPTAHAEIVAIRRACKELKTFQLDGCILYSSCEPCPMCLGAIYWARPSAVYFAATKEDAAKAGFDDDFIYKEIVLLPEDRKIPFFHFLNENSFTPFEKWNKLEAKTKY